MKTSEAILKGGEIPKMSKHTAAEVTKYADWAWRSDVTGHDTDEFLRAYADLLAEQAWIPVTERLPQGNGAVLVAWRSGGMDVQTAEFVRITFSVPLLEEHKVIAWQPLPPAPKGE